MGNPNHLNTTEMAALCGVHRGSVSKWGKKYLAKGDGLVKSAERSNTWLFDTTHPLVLAYIEGKSGHRPASNTSSSDATYPPELTAAAKASSNDRNDLPSKAELAELPTWTMNDPDAMMSMRLHELVDKYGSMAEFRAHVDLVLKLEQIKERRIKNAAASGETIPRDFVSSNLVGFIDAFIFKLLSDAPNTIAKLVVQMARADDTVGKISGAIKSVLSGHVKEVKRIVVGRIADV